MPWAPKGSRAIDFKLDNNSHSDKSAQGREIISSGHDEDRFLALMMAIDMIIDRCEETASKTGRSLLCWLHSTSQVYYSKPFTLVTGHISKRYRTLWKQAIILAFRVYRLRQNGYEAALYILLRHKVTHLLETIWNHTVWDKDNHDSFPEDTPVNYPTREKTKNETATTYDEKSDEDMSCSGDTTDLSETESSREFSTDESGDDCNDPEVLYGSFDVLEIAIIPDLVNQVSGRRDFAQLTDLTFQLYIELLKEGFVDGQPHSTFLIYFCGLLGWSQSSKAFLPPSRYTSHLSGLIYI